MNVIEIIKALIFGIVEGITEWLPISSTGHMILLNELIPLKASPEFYDLFEVVIQLGAIMAVVMVFWKKIWPFGQRHNRYPAAEEGALAWVKLDRIQMWLKVIVACIPAAVVGILLDDVLDRYLHNWVCVAVMLILVGLAFLWVENRIADMEPRVTDLDGITYRMALVIGVFQLVAAIFPGTSRSGATIVGALLLGISRGVAVDFTFILAIPVMLGASLLKLIRFEGAITFGEYAVLFIGMLTAYIVSVNVIQALVSYVKSHDFKRFGWYRIGLGILVILFFVIRGLIAH